MFAPAQATLSRALIGTFGTVICAGACLVGINPQQRPRRRIERRFPQLVGVHFTEPLVALDVEALTAGGIDRRQQV